MGQFVQSGTPINKTATATISVTSCALLGFFVNSTTAGTIVFRTGNAGASSGTAISGTITPAAGTFHPFPAFCVDGLHATIANTLDVTFFVAAG